MRYAVFFSTILLVPMACFNTEFSTNEKINLDHIYSLDAPFEELVRAPRNQFTLLVYYPRLACNSCVNDAIVRVVEVSKYYDQMDYLLVSGETGTYLNNIKRVRQIDFPIFVERADGEAEIHASSLSLFLVDAQTGTAIFKFLPLPGENELRFKKFLENVLVYVDAHSVKGP